MTSLHTLPIARQTLTAHEHSWVVDSRHPTSDGVVLYVRCGGCDTRRVDLQTHPTMPPAALSQELRH
ncbi:hypothetical protein [Microbacterium sp. 3J1]|uniref:hypothetical protein n=1 Tax=Microbacterium sp. 3J1 TaxID=861269 RepID=UPI000A814EAC|nr:hypothetical protein [Microbacterium sp. 3J1]